MNGGLAGRHIEGVAERLAVEGNDLPLGVRVQTLGERKKAASELLRVQPGEQAAESVVAGNPVR